MNNAVLPLSGGQVSLPERRQLRYQGAVFGTVQGPIPASLMQHP